jgi:hypothetical protein
MKKFFTFVLPDEPYKNTTEKKITVNATYEGMRYLYCRVNNQTTQVEGVVFSAENTEDIDARMKDYTEEGYSFITIDAAANPFEAAYLTGEYSHELIEDPEFELPRGLGTWVYHYDDYTGGINQAFFGHDLHFAGGKFTGPRYRTHAITRESLFETAKNQAKTIKQALNENDYVPADRKKLEDHVKWLEDLETTYEGVDHWKISFPTDIPSI